MNIFTVVVILPAGFYPICSCAKQSSVRSLVSKYNPDRCWINENIQETDVPGVCPLWDTNLKISVYCSISLSPYRMDNEVFVFLHRIPFVKSIYCGLTNFNK